jgi:hypothetical protein
VRRSVGAGQPHETGPPTMPKNSRIFGPPRQGGKGGGPECCPPLPERPDRGGRNTRRAAPPRAPACYRRGRRACAWLATAGARGRPPRARACRAPAAARRLACRGVARQGAAGCVRAACARAAAAAQPGVRCRQARDRAAPPASHVQVERTHPAACFGTHVLAATAAASVMSGGLPSCGHAAHTRAARRPGADRRRLRCAVGRQLRAGGRGAHA